MSSGTIRLLITCADARGIIAAVANFVAAHNGNILDADQHSDPHEKQFFMRIEIDPEGFALNRHSFEEAWRPVAQRFGMQWRIHWGEDTKRMAILVSRQDHCLQDLLWRWRTRELAVQIPLVVGNHDDLRGVVESCGLRYEHVPMSAAQRGSSEQRLGDLLAAAAPDFIVLARFMQILSPDFVAAYPQRIINIHHSFLPAFAGRKPYHQAFERGVKIIGATSHYVTDELDEGPIIAQATLPVDHRDTLEDMVRKGRDLERSVLASAVRLHIQDRILVNGNKTVVFE
jgi:formyltetrahydrofolate deformylase